MPWVTLWIEPTKKFSKTTLGLNLSVLMIMRVEPEVLGLGLTLELQNIWSALAKINAALTFNTSSHPQQK